MSNDTKNTVVFCAYFEYKTAPKGNESSLIWKRYHEVYETRVFRNTFDEADLRRAHKQWLSELERQEKTSSRRNAIFRVEPSRRKSDLPMCLKRLKARFSHGKH
jgi:hypothetical protein